MLKVKMDLFLHNPTVTKQLPDSKVHKVVLMYYRILSVREYIKRSRIFGRAITAKPKNPRNVSSGLSLETTPSFSFLPSTFQLSNPLDRRPMALSAIQNEKKIRGRREGST